MPAHLRDLLGTVMLLLIGPASNSREQDAIYTQKCLVKRAARVDERFARACPLSIVLGDCSSRQAFNNMLLQLSFFQDNVAPCFRGIFIQ